MQDGDSTKERTKRNGEQFGQAHLIPKTKSTYIQLQQQLIMHVYKSKNERRATTEYNCYTGTLTQFYFTRLAPHTHIYTKPKRNKSGDFPLRAPSPCRRASGEDGGGECVEGGVVVWMAWLVNPLRHPLSGRAGPPQAALRRLPSASPPTGRAGPRARERARRKGALARQRSSLFGGSTESP